MRGNMKRFNCAVAAASAVIAAAALGCAKPERKADVRKEEVFRLLMDKKAAPDTLALPGSGMQAARDSGK